LGWGVYFDGVSPIAEPVNIQILRQTTDPTGTAATPKLWDNSIGDALQTTGEYNISVEPTDSDVVDLAIIHPQSFYEVIYTIGKELVVGAGDRLGIKITSPAAVNCWAKFIFEE
jgi:hypothetical protein